jgi:hypothetical protein
VADKQAWNWLDVLIFPVLLALVGIWYQATEADRDNKRQRVQRQRDIRHANEQRRREERAVEKQTEAAALEAYLDQMGYLLIEKDLRNAPENSDIRALAQARTLTILLRLEAERKRHPLKLVAQMHLIDKGSCVIRLPHADLNDADLTEANLRGTVLADADLRNANLKGARSDAATLWPDGFDPETAGVVVE